jgi:hypothetical protein
LDILGVPVDATDDKGLTAVRMLLGSTLARLFEMSLSRAPVPMGWEDGRGARSVPDTLVLYRKKVDHHRAEIAAGAMQRIAAGGAWWECRSAHAAMWALARSGVCFRTLTNDDGTLER